MYELNIVFNCSIILSKEFFGFITIFNSKTGTRIVEEVYEKSEKPGATMAPT